MSLGGDNHRRSKRKRGSAARQNEGPRGGAQALFWRQYFHQPFWRQYFHQPVKGGDEMGCDVHMVLEQKVGDKWRGLKAGEHYETRNYSDYAMLSRCGRREEIEPIVEPRGIPQECSHAYKALLEEWEQNDHSHSWMTMDELREGLMERMPESRTSNLWAILDSYWWEESVPEDCRRICYFFDN